MPAKKKNEAKSKNSGPNSRARNVMRESRPASVGIPTEDDIRFIRDTKLPPPIEGRVIHNTYTAYTDDALDALGWPEVADFFGSRVRKHAVSESVTRARRTEEISAKMDHAKELLAQNGAPANADLYTVAGLIVRDWDELKRKLPDAAEKLQPIYDWWVASHPGGSRPAKADESTPTPKPVTPA